MESHDEVMEDGETRVFWRERLHGTLTSRLVGVALLVALLLAPLAMIQKQIAQRATYQAQAETEIANTAGGPQTLLGPVLAIRYRMKASGGRYRDMNTGEVLDRSAPLTEERIAFVPARTLAIRGRADVEQRYRGIYPARLFHLDLNIEGSFSLPAELLAAAADKGEIAEARAVMLFGLSSPRGMDAAPEVLVDQRPLRFAVSRDKRFDAILPGGARLEVDIGELLPGKANVIDFAFPLKLTGAKAFYIAPTAENNVVHVQSNWAHPSFHGRFLPRTRHIERNGFGAQWEISYLARDIEKALQPDSGEVLGVEFMQPVDVYRQSERAAKYGSLFVVLTFAAFFLGEVLSRRPMHLMQYLLVGLALTIFFLLLVALSEQLPFLRAYVVAAAACVGLIVFYLAGVFASWRLASAFGCGLAGLYATLYVILQLEEKSLLMGSLLLFAVLAAIMTSTRRINWYELTGNEKTARRGRKAKHFPEWPSRQFSPNEGE
ncbi:MAG: cell envelope integrity protein CreD [Azoarcus sp.]|jgi:inner membrane protein|nr:cell envelope integrity protein CreD [Azoarcus sp.]